VIIGDKSTDKVTLSSADNQLILRFDGGFKLYTDKDLATGVYMNSGAGGWMTVCDRNRKERFTPVDGESILVGIRTLAISEWSYRHADPGIRYIGPTAQDFHRAFQLGGTDSLGINSINADGISLAAVQALERRTSELRAVVREQENAIAALRAEVAQLKREMATRRTARTSASR
jgi:trimeric autotransporter adhesin